MSKGKKNCQEGADELQEQVRRLTAQLEQEKAKLIACQAEVAEQRGLKKTFIRKEKELRRELERIQRFSDPETLKHAELATQVDTSNKKKKKMVIKKEFEELQVAFTSQQEMLKAQLQAERDKNEALQGDLDRLQAEQEKNRALQEQVDTLQAEQEKNRLQMASNQQMIADLHHAVEVEKELNEEHARQLAITKKQKDEAELLNMQLTSEVSGLREALHVQVRGFLLLKEKKEEEVAAQTTALHEEHRKEILFLKGERDHALMTAKSEEMEVVKEKRMAMEELISNRPELCEAARNGKKTELTLLTDKQRKEAKKAEKKAAKQEAIRRGERVAKWWQFWKR